MTPFHFAEEIPGGCPSYCDARAIILPVPYEHTTSYLKGTARGPEAILTASQEIELFDEKLGYEVYRLMSMHTLPSFPVDCCGAEFLAKLESEVRIHLANGKLMVMLGGEHTITLAAVRAARAIVSGIAVLQIDAHADLRDSYLGDPFSHATVMRRVLEHAPVYQIGVRSLSAPEFDLVKAKAVTTLFCHDSSVGNINAFVDALPEEIYLTIDMDGFDPSVVPGVGTPEPGGLSWNSIDYILDRVSTRCRIRAFDVVELRPLPNEARSEVTAARLIYRLLGYIARAENSEK
ncbi:MAG TPA: agmatinase [Thermodesulfobacteriota bacterium]|nr:agmatinase [Deltaproteobacteria bacterium]HNR13120.1 agmatinase [Thermodesulfobacteriota bacterium]HNU70755.1 agmatinase [Thermodesulfobacteriota bacterium]HOC37801.1 agmatinase [Thermodesulfobacteriota bacterium]HQO78320.1 agmatinase [Thermodesulfobacteriota bacterium]